MPQTAGEQRKYDHHWSSVHTINVN